MFTEEMSLSLMQQCLDGLQKSGMIDAQIIVKPDMPLFGEGSQLDSMGFVTFITDIEERIIDLSKKDIFIVLSDIEEMYPNAPVLTASMFGSYLVSITN
ncbi:hypothetical protein [Polynucleobacter sp. UB-Raua-W9]|uniref:hypothetical protein n=1 Tax=Polynucleobacter sp. UB-Raua-W9 TaxID=1819736 RepID=UPI001BFCF411|nr:hypothetical protein [Polynucleobacter sp. UB-Raua-W9]QWD72738.1 hypothetical protein AOC07_01770 [Polynucleobacter sp. UB-Raua-W9]